MNWQTTSDNFLKYQKGDSDVVDGLFGDLSRYLHACVRSKGLSTETANDIIQTSLLKVHLHRDRYDPTMPLRAWIITIFSRTVTDHFRTDKSRRHEGDVGVIEGIVDPSQMIDEKLVAAEFFDLLQPTEQTLVYNHVWNGEKLRDIAKMEGVTVSAIKSRFQRSLQRLRKL